MSKLPDLAGTLIGVLVLSAVSAFQASNAWGQASDVVCSGCVDTNDLANGAVTFPKLAADVADSIPELTSVVRSVDCAMGQTITGTIDSLPRGQVTSIGLLSNCIEDVTITRDDITLDGDPTNMGVKNTLDGTITVDNAQRGVIQEIEITGSGDGVVAENAASISIVDAEIVLNSSNGVSVLNSAHANIDSSTISNNGNVGVLVGFGASARLTSNAIQGNGTFGMQITRGSYARGGLNTISGNSNFAVVVSVASTYTADATSISEPGRETITASGSPSRAFRINDGSTVFLREAVVNGSVDVFRLSQFQTLSGGSKGGVAFSGSCINDPMPSFTLCP